MTWRSTDNDRPAIDIERSQGLEGVFSGDVLLYGKVLGGWDWRIGYFDFSRGRYEFYDDRDPYTPFWPTHWRALDTPGVTNEASK